MKIRKSEDRGTSDYGWLKAQHSFLFSNYYDPKFMGFHNLRVLNEDRIKGHTGFPTHPHANMEIITFIISGELTHKDSMGNQGTLKPGDIQVMTAGSGIVHSEMNSGDDLTHLYQIWIEPQKRDAQPNYTQKNFASLFKKEGAILIASGAGLNGALKIGQDAQLWSHRWKKKMVFTITPEFRRPIWIQAISGGIKIEGQSLNAGDGLGIEANAIPAPNRAFSVEVIENAQILAFHL